MISAVLLFQVPLLTAQPPPEPPPQPTPQASEAVEVEAPPPAPPPRARRPVSSRPLDLSTVASRVRLNLKALEGWEPKKGTAAPPIEYTPDPEPAATRSEPRREPIARIVNLEPSRPEWESVNAYEGPRPSFYGPPPCWHQGGYGECAHGRDQGRGHPPQVRRGRDRADRDRVDRDRPPTPRDRPAFTRPPEQRAERTSGVATGGGSARQRRTGR